MADFELLAPGGHQKLVDEVVDRLDLKADVDGYYAQLTAGAADNLTGRGDATTAEFLYRTAGGTADIETGQAVAKSIKGNTLVWNQLADNGNFANGSTHWAARESTLTVADGVATATPTSDGTARGLQASSTMGTAVIGHKYLISTEFNTDEATNLNLSFSGANYVTVVVPSTGVWQKCGAIWTNSNNETRILPYLLTAANVTTSAQLKYRNVQIFDLTQMFGAGNEPSTVAEFEALFPLPYYEYDAGSLLSVNMEGIETVGFNQWDEEWEKGYISDTTGENGGTGATYLRSKNHLPVFPETEYHFTRVGTTGNAGKVYYYDAAKAFISWENVTFGGLNKTTPANARYMRFWLNYTGDYQNDICINLSWSGRRNGEYAPYWQQERTIPAGTLRGAGTAYDELTETERITRVGEVDLGTLTWIVAATGSTGQYRMVSSELRALVQKPASNAVLANITCQKYDAHTSNEVYQLNVGICVDAAGDLVVYDPNYATSESAAAFKVAMSGVMLHYALATPTTTPIDPALNLSYRVDDFGTERVMVPENERSAPPVLDIAYGLNVVDFVRRAPTEYISAASFRQYLLARDAHDGTTTTMTWDDTDNRYEFAITDTVTEG